METKLSSEFVRQLLLWNNSVIYNFFLVQTIQLMTMKINLKINFEFFYNQN